MDRLQSEIDKEILDKIDKLYNKCIWTTSKGKEVDVMDMNDKYFNTVLKIMRVNYGQRFNLWEKENRLRRVRKEFRDSHYNSKNLNLVKYNQMLDNYYKEQARIAAECPF